MRRIYRFAPNDLFFLVDCTMSMMARGATLEERTIEFGYKLSRSAWNVLLVWDLAGFCIFVSEPAPAGIANDQVLWNINRMYMPVYGGGGGPPGVCPPPSTPSPARARSTGRNHRRAGSADLGIVDPPMLRNDMGPVQTRAEHGIRRLKAGWRMCDSGLERRRSSAETFVIWKVAASIHNRRLRLYGPNR